MKHKLMKLVLVSSIFVVILTGCNEKTESQMDITRQQEVANKLVDSQPIPTDIDYSLERYNLIRRAYWVNGQREKADQLECPVEKPLGYIILFNSDTVVGRYVVDGKVSSLNSFLTPNAYDEYISNGGVKTIELPDVDGSYGENDGGIFFFTPDGNYMEWNDKYLYSDIPFEVEDPVLKVGE